MQRYPDVVPDCSFENRQVDLIAEGFDAAIGGGMELASGVVARQLSRLAASHARTRSRNASCAARTPRAYPAYDLSTQCDRAKFATRVAAQLTRRFRHPKSIAPHSSLSSTSTT